MKSKNSLTFAVCIGSALSLLGCGKVSLSLGGLTPNTPSLGAVSLSSGADFVSTSQNGVRTVNSYSVQAAAGASFSKLVATTQSGYQIFSTFEGQLTSEEEQVQAAATAASGIN